MVEMSMVIAQPILTPIQRNYNSIHFISYKLTLLSDFPYKYLKFSHEKHKSTGKILAGPQTAHLWESYLSAQTDFEFLKEVYKLREKNESSHQRHNRQHNDGKVTCLGCLLGLPVELSNGIAVQAKHKTDNQTYIHRGQMGIQTAC